MASRRRLRRVAESKRRTKACGEKKRHATLQAARYAIYASAKVLDFNGFMNPYKCPFCEFYHIGHAGSKYKGATA